MSANGVRRQSHPIIEKTPMARENCGSRPCGAPGHAEDALGHCLGADERLAGGRLFDCDRPSGLQGQAKGSLGGASLFWGGFSVILNDPQRRCWMQLSETAFDIGELVRASFCGGWSSCHQGKGKESGQGFGRAAGADKAT